jgi:hypothetical protein
MASTRSKPGDPISDRARALNAEIASLESQIRDLGARLDSTRSARVKVPQESATEPEPVFESVASTGNKTPPPAARPKTPSGTRSPSRNREGLWPRLMRAFRPPQSSNPRLINYLAAGSIQGLRPLRYEKRVARNRVVALSLILLFIIWGLVAVLQR